MAFHQTREDHEHLSISIKHTQKNRIEHTHKHTNKNTHTQTHTHTHTHSTTAAHTLSPSHTHTEQLDMAFYETSAKDKSMVDEAFFALTRDIKTRLGEHSGPTRNAGTVQV